MSSAALLRRATLPKRRRYSQAAAATRILGCGARHLPPGPPHHMVLHRSDGAACIIAIAMILAAQNGHLKVGRPCSATAMSVGQAAEARELLEESYRWCHPGAMIKCSLCSYQCGKHRGGSAGAIADVDMAPRTHLRSQARAC